MPHGPSWFLSNFAFGAVCLGKARKLSIKTSPSTFGFLGRVAFALVGAFPARLFSQAGLESSDVIYVPRNSWRKNGCDALHCSLPIRGWKLSARERALRPEEQLGRGDVLTLLPVTPFRCAAAIRVRKFLVLHG